MDIFIRDPILDWTRETQKGDDVEKHVEMRVMHARSKLSLLTQLPYAPSNANQSTVNLHTGKVFKDSSLATTMAQELELERCAKMSSNKLNASWIWPLTLAYSRTAGRDGKLGCNETTVEVPFRIKTSEIQN